MINLIPPKAKKKLLSEYWVRVISSWLILWSVVLLMGAAVTVPPYVLINSQISVYKESVLSASDKVSDYKNVSTNLVNSSQQARFIVDEKNLPVVSEYIKLFESMEGRGVRISTISLARDDSGFFPVSISGLADNRQSLANFRDRIVAEDRVLDVNLPISNLAREADINFSLTVTLNNNGV